MKMRPDQCSATRVQSYLAVFFARARVARVLACNRLIFENRARVWTQNERKWKFYFSLSWENHSRLSSPSNCFKQIKFLKCQRKVRPALMYQNIWSQYWINFGLKKLIIFKIARAQACVRVFACKTAFFKKIYTHCTRARRARVACVHVSPAAWPNTGPEQPEQTC